MKYFCRVHLIKQLFIDSTSKIEGTFATFFSELETFMLCKTAELGFL